MPNRKRKPLIYVGQGFLPGVPARDLSSDDLVLITLSRSELLDSGVYAPAPEPDEPAPEPAEDLPSSITLQE